MCVGGILDDCQPMLLGDGRHGIQIHRLAGEMHHEDGQCSGRDGLLDPGGINLVRIRVHVHKDRHEVVLQDAGRAGHIGIGGHDDFIANVEVHCPNTHLQGSGAVGRRDAISAAVASGELRLEQSDLPLLAVAGFGQLHALTECEPPPLAAAVNMHHRVFLGLVQYRPLHERLIANGRAAMNCEFRHVCLLSGKLR